MLQLKLFELYTAAAYLLKAVIPLKEYDILEVDYLLGRSLVNDYKANYLMNQMTQKSVTSYCTNF